MTVVHLTQQKGPIGDPVTGLVAPDAWDVFETPGGKAYVLVHPGGVFLLHWIEVFRPRGGVGTILLEAIGRWADLCGLQGRLTCDAALADFYSRDGWYYTGHFGQPRFIEMWRMPRG
jgi:hypothetical protein